MADGIAAGMFLAFLRSSVRCFCAALRRLACHLPEGRHCGPARAELASFCHFGLACSDRPSRLGARLRRLPMAARRLVAHSLSADRQRMRLQPQRPGGEQSDQSRRSLHHAASSPQRWTSRWWPRHKRHGELVADLAAERPALREAQVVRVRRLAAADQARLLGDESDMVAVADPPRLRQGERALVDRRWTGLPFRSAHLLRAGPRPRRVVDRFG